MEYGHIEWKVDTVVYRITGGVLSKTTETDEGRCRVMKSVPDAPRVIRFQPPAS